MYRCLSLFGVLVRCVSIVDGEVLFVVVCCVRVGCWLFVVVRLLLFVDARCSVLVVRRRVLFARCVLLVVGGCCRCLMFVVCCSLLFWLSFGVCYVY